MGTPLSLTRARGDWGKRLGDQGHAEFRLAWAAGIQHVPDPIRLTIRWYQRRANGRRKSMLDADAGE
jgi:hypothetical protein